VAYWNRTDLENALGPATVAAIYDDAVAADGSINDGALTSVQQRSDATVNSYIAVNYPKATLPVDPVPDTLKFASLEYGIVYSRDRKPEYWKTTQEHERQERLKAANAQMDQYIAAQRFLYDMAVEPKPANVGGLVYDTGPRTIIDSADGTSNGGDF
jgi:uncharacterized protein DUF1320